MPNRRESPVARVNPSGKKVWVARYTEPGGRRRSAGTFKTKREAQSAIDEDYRRPPARDTVGEYARDWTRRYPRSARTDKTNRGAGRCGSRPRARGAAAEGLAAGGPTPAARR